MADPVQRSEPATADVLAVLDLVAAYADAVDERRFDDLLDVFTADAQASYGGVALEPGVEAIIRHVSGLAGFARSQHLLGNVRVRFDGPDRGRSSCAGLVHLVRADGQLLVRGLRYEHALVRSEQGWRFAALVHSARFMWQGTADHDVAPDAVTRPAAPAPSTPGSTP